ncbi:MAG: hypothetical protein PWP51_2223 [Clostridiales bacterium]|jgi:uncharacterized protein YrzB (UPF0473 family)|nr:hypothetical protein [Clostridiales bacterium]MDN5299670.1 hypothetical protein [Clostridiales bacterium]
MDKDKALFEIVEPEGENSDVVELFDDNGNPVQFNIIATLEVDEQEYAILSNVDDDDEVLIFKVTEEDEEFIFETIDDEEELQAVIEAYNELLDEMES